MTNRLEQQIKFIREVDKLKNVFRQSYLLDTSRKENDAEHTWHLAMMAVVLQEHCPDDKLDINRTLKMLLVHDLVEIDAGDTFAYDEAGQEGKFEREKLAAERIFGLLPADQRDEFMSLWLEFEERETTEAVYAAAIDRLQPLLHNYYTEGKAWKEHGVSGGKVLARIQFLSERIPVLFTFAEGLVQDAVGKGYLLP
ncbi:HD domain-containing protein [Paenibacillus sediminis]|uniref:Hydrolase of HD superfamily n=1 Tax=Paenibacillus sediminis TaxID=664909 RepID=A0ABS4H1S7_9BACL|nr:HD domain-containing protein [Paenibacillus sediminis]MBP1936479.1 putative hydrolase of HD superfamily [Paenibacillus sediminis]